MLQWIKKGKKILLNGKIKNFFLYAGIFFLLANAVTGLGSLFPYLAEHTNKSPTDYSYLLICRAVGFILGAFTVKFLQTYFSYHQFLTLGAYTSGVFLIIFSTFQDSIYLQGVCIFFYGIGSAYIVTFVNGQNLQKWLQLVHGSFGIGGLLGPLLIYFFQLYSYLYLGIAFLVCIPFASILESPEKAEKQQSQKHQISEKQSQKRILSNKNILMLSISFLFVIGQERIYTGQIASFAVLEKFSTKEHATLYSSLYWISITFFRFFLTLFNGSASRKLKILIALAVIWSIIGSFLIFKINSQIGLILTSLVFGLSDSILVPLLFSLPAFYGLEAKASQSSLFMMFGYLGQAIVTLITGVTMKVISAKMFLVVMGGVNLIAFCMQFFLQKSLKNEKLCYEKQEMEKKEKQIHFI